MRYSGRIGYFDTVETKPGFFSETLIFKKANGDVVRNTKRNIDSNKVNSDIRVSNSISVVADPYAQTHFFNIKCIEWQGALWEVSSVSVEYPRLILELGGLYREDLGELTSDPSGSTGG